MPEGFAVGFPPIEEDAFGIRRHNEEVRTFTDKKNWFFKPWNAETVKNPTTGRNVAFEDAPADLLLP